jgi:RNA polymerase sigma-70 factor (ECF subfamily)
MTADTTATVDRARAGDREAFGELYAEHRDEIHRYLLRRTGDRELATDLTSETFLRALRRLHSFTWQGGGFGAWLTTIARNLALDHAKRASTRREVTVADMVDGSLEPSPEDTVVNQMEAAAQAHAVRAALDTLTGRQRDCLQLRFGHGRTPREIADLTGSTERAVITLQQRALRALRHSIAASSPEEPRQSLDATPGRRPARTRPPLQAAHPGPPSNPAPGHLPKGTRTCPSSTPASTCA